jgi:hypothetical protein
MITAIFPIKPSAVGLFPITVKGVDFLKLASVQPFSFRRLPEFNILSPVSTNSTAFGLIKV